MKKKRLNESSESTIEDPYSLFVFAMNAAQTREKYITRLDRFFHFINVQGTTIKERCRSFAELAKKDNNNYSHNRHIGRTASLRDNSLWYLDVFDNTSNIIKRE